MILFITTTKKTHSIILMAIAGPNYECLWADVGCNGWNNDEGVWNKSELHKSIKDGTIKLPESETLT